ncbi:DUF6630 family protein [Coralloluteibacterium stylophorae]|uniref:DUF6630 domain-containing protein n=1 Tax=Coralloluteibacterium stylophorae TaxID=1776034 RepID=A0A8J7VQ62_9GAMM|nr:hypothetical protein [Coralloluteibacterium stylophorae]MBS7457348.1 hypothetical protein [Coralloluteibacterium stylophorae]
MPDNSDAWDDPSDLGHDYDEDDFPARVWNLLVLINPGDEETALRQFDAWRDTASEPGDEAWLESLRDVVDWTSGFHVAQDDPATLMTAVDELVARWNLRIDWGGDADDEDFLADNDAGSLLATAYDQLRTHGYTLWTLYTGDDTATGWMTLSRDDEGLLALCGLLGVDVRQASEFG